MSAAIVLFGHGSRDAGWRAPMDEVARRIRERAPGRPVACAFLELQPPSLGEAVDDLVTAGAREVTVLPMFLGLGRHAREELPTLVDQVRQRHPGVLVRVLPSAGENPEVLDLLATAALR